MLVELAPGVSVPGVNMWPEKQAFVNVLGA